MAACRCAFLEVALQSLLQSPLFVSLGKRLSLVLSSAPLCVRVDSTKNPSTASPRRCATSATVPTCWRFNESSPLPSGYFSVRHRPVPVTVSNPSITHLASQEILTGPDGAAFYTYPVFELYTPASGL